MKHNGHYQRQGEVMDCDTWLKTMHELFRAIEEFLDNPSDWPGGQTDRSIRQAYYKLTGWKADWDTHNKYDDKHECQQVEHLIVKKGKQ